MPEIFRARAVSAFCLFGRRIQTMALSGTAVARIYGHPPRIPVDVWEFHGSGGRKDGAKTSDYHSGRSSYRSYGISESMISRPSGFS